VARPRGRWCGGRDRLESIFYVGFQGGGGGKRERLVFEVLGSLKSWEERWRWKSLRCGVVRHLDGIARCLLGSQNEEFMRNEWML